VKRSLPLGIGLPPVLVQVHRVLAIGKARTEEQVIAEHQHLDHELLCIDAGRYRCRIDGREHSAVRGELLVVTPGDWHEDQLRGPLRYRAICLTSVAAEAGLPAPLLAGDAPRVMSLSAAAQDAYDRCEAAWNAPDEAAGALVQARATELLWLLAQQLPSAVRGRAFRAPAPAEDLEARLERCFARHLQEQVPLATLAAEMQMPLRSLHHRCHHLLGMSPGRAFTRYRLRHSADLLRSTEMTVAAVAEALGYASPYQLSAAFKRVYGSSPQRYRNGS